MPDETNQLTRGRYLGCGHTAAPLEQSAIHSPHKIASIRGDTDDLEDSPFDNVHGNATRRDHPHDTGDIYSMLSVHSSRVSLT